MPKPPSEGQFLPPGQIHTAVLRRGVDGKSAVIILHRCDSTAQMFTLSDEAEKNLRLDVLEDWVKELRRG